MKRRNLLKSVVLSLAVLVSVTLAPTASASVIGHLSVFPGTPPCLGELGGGGVTVSATSINWSPGSPAACLQTGLGTNVASAAGNMLTNSTVSFSGTGTINDLALPAGSDPGIAGFMTFTGGGLTSPLLFNLAAVAGFGPGSAVSCATNPGLNNSCSIPPGGNSSPFILTQGLSNQGVPNTSVTLSAQGTIVDPVDGVTSYWSGSFTTQINNQLPADIQSIITAGGSITSTFSGEFDVSPVPEPISVVLIGAGLIVLGAIKRRKLA